MAIISQQWDKFAVEKIGAGSMAIFPLMLQKTIKRTFYSGGANVLAQVEEILARQAVLDGAPIVTEEEARVKELRILAENLRLEINAFAEACRKGRE